MFYAIKKHLRIRVKEIRFYTILVIVSTILSLVLTLVVFVPFLPQKSPTGTFDIGVGPVPEAERNNTKIEIDIPDQTINVQVTFRFNQTMKYFIYVYLPYTIEWATPYVIHDTVVYPLSNDWLRDNPSSPEIGNISKNYKPNLSIVNATVELNPSFPAFHFWYPDGKDELTIGVNIKVHESLIAFGDNYGSSQTAMFTFFGNNPEEYTDEIYPYKQPLSQMTIGYPFIVDVRLPPSCFYIDGQPTLNEYYVREDQRWVKLSIDFPEGNYAQTIVLNFADPNGQYLKELSVLLIGIFVTLSITFVIEVIHAKRKEKERESATDMVGSDI